MDNRPDFIVDSSGKVVDVRHNKNASQPYQKNEQRNGPTRQIPTQNWTTYKPPNKKRNISPTFIVIPIGLILTIIIAVGKLLFPSSESNSSLSETDFLNYNLAVSNYLDGKYDMANMYLTIEIQSNPKYAPAYNISGLIYAGQKKFENALAEYDHAIVLQPNCADCYNNRRIAYPMMDDNNNAIMDYNRAIAIDGRLAKAYQNRGIAYRVLEKFDVAISDFNSTIEYSTNYLPIYSIQKTQEKDNGFISDLNKQTMFFQSAADLPFVHYFRGLAYLFLGDEIKASLDFEKAASLGYIPENDFKTIIPMED